MIVDEAARVKQSAWTQALRPTLADHKGSALFISTPTAKNWFYDLYKRGTSTLPEDKDWESWQFSSYDNKYLSRKEIEEMARDMDALTYEQEILAKFVEGQGQVFADIRAHVTAIARPPEAGKMYYIGIDLGGRYDSSAICVFDTDTMDVVFVEKYEDVDWPVMKGEIKNVYERYNYGIVTVDATSLGGSNAVQELEDMGVPVEPFKFTSQTKNSLVMKLSRWWQLKNDGYYALAVPDHPELLNELEIFTFKQRENGFRVYSAPNGKHDDLVMALALSIWNVDDPTSGNDIEFFPALQSGFA